MNERVEHVVVLMLENRSFDHLLGFFPSGQTPFEGLTGNEANYENPLDKTGLRVQVSDDAPYVPDIDPCPEHDAPNVHVQLFGRLGAWPGDPGEDHNNGFLYDYAQVTHDVAAAAKVMRCHRPANVPALTALAQSFALCDHWFASVPGPTWPNRFFVHAATSGGHTDNAVRLYAMRTIYQNLSAAGVPWRVYFHDFPQSLALTNQLRYVSTNYEYVDRFFAACAGGSLPGYSFIEPRYFNAGPFRANDQHPVHGVAGGDTLIADVYRALRNGPQWDKTLLIVATDEHGGLYDHVFPPKTVNPDGLVSPQFDFTRLGVRVPAVVASPWIPKGTVASAVYDHATIAATLREVFDLPDALTKRDAQANTLTGLLTAAAPRADAPLDLPRASDADVALIAAAQSSERRMSRFQASLVTLAHSIVQKGPALFEEPLTADTVTTEHEGALLAKFAFAAIRTFAPPRQGA